MEKPGSTPQSFFQQPLHEPLDEPVLLLLLWLLYEHLHELLRRHNTTHQMAEPPSLLHNRLHHYHLRNLSKRHTHNTLGCMHLRTRMSKYKHLRLCNLIRRLLIKWRSLPVFSTIGLITTVFAIYKSVTHI